MKKKVLLFLILVLVMNLTLVACGNKEEADKPNQEDESIESIDDEESEGITVDKSLLTVDITLPATLVGDLSDFNEEEYIAENEGIKAVKINKDGSITLTMTKKKHGEIINEMKDEVEASLSELIESEDTPYIKGIKYTKDFRKVKIIVDRDAYEDAFDLTPFTVGITVGMYQAYSGDEFYTKIIIEDVDTGEEIGSVIYPDALED